MKIYLMRAYFEALLLFKPWETVRAPGSFWGLGYRPPPTPWCPLLLCLRTEVCVALQMF